VYYDNFCENNQLDASISKMYFCHKTLHVLGIFCAHHQGLSTVHSVLVCFMLVSDDSARKQPHNLHEAYQLPCVQWITPDDGHRRCPKHVGFYDKNKFCILMHLVVYFHKTKVELL